MTSTRVIVAFVKVNVSARDSLPRGAKINPTDPLMSAGCTNCRPRPRESAMNCAAHVDAPLTSRALPASAAGAWMRDAASMRRTASGSSTARRASRSPVARRPQKRLHHFALTSPAGVRWRWRAAHPPARAARELLCRGRRPPHDRTDLVERHGEQIMQNERQGVRRASACRARPAARRRPSRRAPLRLRDRRLARARRSAR